MANFGIQKGQHRQYIIIFFEKNAYITKGCILIKKPEAW